MWETQAGVVNHGNEVREVRGVFEPQIINTRYSCSCLVYRGYFDIFLHILVGSKNNMISGARGTYSHAFIVCTCDKDEFFVF